MAGADTNQLAITNDLRKKLAELTSDLKRITQERDDLINVMADFDMRFTDIQNAVSQLTKERDQVCIYNININSDIGH
jgi:predicted  nucleic acid-binding Zn-ribbon protein